MAISAGDTGIANGACARAFVDGLAAAISHACVTPGSRSTPLTVALARQSVIRPWLHLDERSSAFFALGLARATGQPVAVVCTSGTAAANFHPAVVEADLSRIPLVLCTADRPPRLRDVGADQTMMQPGMFGAAARWANELPLPCGRDGEERQFRAVAVRAAGVARGPLPGPVQLNFPFEEPLTGAQGASWAHFPEGVKVGLSASGEYPPAEDVVEAAAGVMRRARRPLIIAGPETGGLPAEAIGSLAARLNAPIVADPLSGLRCGGHDRSLVLDSYDAILREAPPAELVPDCVIRFGAKPTSKALNQFLAQQPTAAHILCDLPGSWRDPDALSTMVVHGNPGAIASALAAEIDGGQVKRGWAARWLAANDAAGEAMREHSTSVDELFEGRIFTELQQLCPPGRPSSPGTACPSATSIPSSPRIRSH